MVKSPLVSLVHEISAKISILLAAPFSTFSEVVGFYCVQIFIHGFSLVTNTEPQDCLGIPSKKHQTIGVMQVKNMRTLYIRVYNGFLV